MILQGDSRDRFIVDIRSILTLQERHRLPSQALERRLRVLGWKGWNSLGAFVQLCRQAGFFTYEGLGRQNSCAHFVALEVAPLKEPDFFQRVGYVVAVQPGMWVNRSRPVKTTSVRAKARVWATRSGVLGYCQRLGHPVVCIQDTRSIDDGAA